MGRQKRGPKIQVSDGLYSMLSDQHVREREINKRDIGRDEILDGADQSVYRRARKNN